MTTTPSRDAGRAAAGTVALAVLQTASRALAMVFVVVATREILPDQFARYSVIAGLVVFAGFLADFGSSTVITRTVSRDAGSSDRLLAQTIVASVVVGTAAYLAIVAFVSLGPYPAVMRGDAAIGGLAVPIDAALTSVLAAFDGHGLISRRAVVSFVRVAVVAAGGIAAVVLTGDIRPAIAAIALGPAVALVLGAVLARRHGVWFVSLHPNWRRSVELFRNAFPYALLGGIGAVVARLDLLVLSWVSNGPEIAGYDLALRGAESATALGLVVGGPALFILSRRLGEGDAVGARRAYAHAARVAYLIGIPLATVLVALHAPIARLAFGPEYSDTGTLLAILGVGVWLSVLSAVQGAVILAHGDTGRALRASGLVLLVAIGLDFGLIPAFDATGAAAATVGAAIATYFLFDALVRRILTNRTPWPAARLLASCALSGLAMYGATVVGPQWLGFLALPLLPLLLWWTGALTIDDARHLRRLVAVGNRA